MICYRPRSRVCGHHLEGRQPNCGAVGRGADQPNVPELSGVRRRAAPAKMGRNAGGFCREEDGVMQPEVTALGRLHRRALWTS
jgi:hypothetical protein